MTKLAIALALSSAIITPAFAATETNVNITANVGSVCEFSALTAGGVDPSTPIVLTVDTDSVHTGIVEATAATTRAMRLKCNQPFVVNLESAQGAVRRSSVANGGDAIDTKVLGGTMAKAIGYTATPKLTDLDTTLFTGAYTNLVAKDNLGSGEAPVDKITATNVAKADTGGENSGGAYDGLLEIGIATDTSATLVAGSYSDTLRVILIAQ